MFNKIIIGYDGFDGGKDAAALAPELASPGAEIVLVNVFPHDEFAARGTREAFERWMEEDAQQVIREALVTHPGYRVHAIPSSHPAEALRAYAEEIGADLIVVGSDHHSPVGRIFLGDVTRGVVHHAPCTVLVAPKGYRTREVVAS